MPTKPPDLGVVFGAGAMPEDDEAMGAQEPGEDVEDDGDEMDEALDAAIDDLFAAEDPEARREAFKTAVGLCKESKY